MANSEYVTISVRKDLIPEGTKLIEAYKTKDEIIVLGNPYWFCHGHPSRHNCDAMGCSSVAHVIIRRKLSPAYIRSQEAHNAANS
jgi:hypothetical protein